MQIKWAPEVGREKRDESFVFFYFALYSMRFARCTHWNINCFCATCACLHFFSLRTWCNLIGGFAGYFFVNFNDLSIVMVIRVTFLGIRVARVEIWMPIVSDSSLPKNNAQLSAKCKRRDLIRTEMISWSTFNLVVTFVSEFVIESLVHKRLQLKSNRL